MPDKFSGLPPIVEGYTDFQAITPDDENDLPTYARAIWVGTAGDIAVLGRDGGGDPANAEVLKNVPAGLWKFYVRRVLKTGTTATDLIACI